MDSSSDTLELLASLQKELNERKKALEDMQRELASVTETYKQQQQFLMEQLQILTKIKKENQELK